MANPFDTASMAAGYANARPPVHARIIERARAHMPRKVRRALDAGCGAGISTRALSPLAERCVGIEPAVRMLALGATVAPGAVFAAAAAEALPFLDASMDLIAAAGSLNYVRLDAFFKEAARVLAPAGRLLVYDFSQGRSFRGDRSLDEWFAAFMSRYPAPAHEALELDPDILSRVSMGFIVTAQERFEIPITLAPEFYLEYMLTESNVAAAVRAGIAQDEIRAWCAATLAPVWQGRDREVLFRGYWAVLEAA
jgi:SAM-dependent methyltransferase